MVLLLITVIVWSISFQFQPNFGLITDFTAPAAPLCAFAENKLAAALVCCFFLRSSSCLSPHVFLAPLMEQWNMGWLPNHSPPSPPPLVHPPVTCRDASDGCTRWKLAAGLCKSKLNCEVKRLGPVTPVISRRQQRDGCAGGDGGTALKHAVCAHTHVGALMSAHTCTRCSVCMCACCARASPCSCA